MMFMFASTIKMGGRRRDRVPVALARHARSSRIVIGSCAES
jgi:hypothetical protein